MKKIFTKTLGFVAAIILFVGMALPVSAQFVKKSYETNNEFYTAVTKDPNGNIYAIRSGDGVHASVIKYAPNSTSFTTLFSGLAAGGGDEANAGFLAWGLAVNSHGDVYCTTNLSAGNTGAGTNVVNGSALPNHGNVIKLASNNGYNGTVYTASVFLSAGLYYTSLAFDSSDNLYVVQTDNTSLSHYTVTRYAAGTTNATQLLNDLNDDATDNYPHGLAIASNNDIFVCDAAAKKTGGTSGHIGLVRHYTSASGYASHTNVSSSNTYPMAVALDPSGNLYVSETDGTAFANYRLNKYSSSTHALISGNIATLTVSGGVHPDGIAAVNSHNIYVAGGGNPSDFFELIGPATTPASGINFTATTTTSTTINWTNGDGDGRSVFVALASSGTPSPANGTDYSASTTFGSGAQAGSGWYCVFNGTTGGSVNVTGLTTGNTYRAMVVEYNGSAAISSENYLTTSNSGNTANVTTQSPTTITSLNRVTGQYSNAASVSFAAVFGSAVTGVTASNFSVTTTGVSGVTNASIGTPTTSDNITWTVPVSTGTGDGTIQLSLANATGMSKTISTSLPFAGQPYTIDKTPPTVTISAPSVTVVNSSVSISYTVTWADANINAPTESLSPLTAYNNRQMTGTATVNQVQTSVISGNQMTVAFSNITGDGTFNWSIPANTAQDLAGNQATAGAAPSQTVTIDNTAPTLTIVRSDPNPISANVLDFQAVFSEPVTGVTGSSFMMTNTGVTTGAVSATMIDSKTYNITVGTVAGTGTARLDLVAGGATDLAGNQAAAFNGGTNATYDVDQTAPTATAITATTPGNASPTNATSVVYTVSFSKSVTGVDGTDFSLATSGTSGTIGTVTGSGTTYTVPVNSITGTGTLGLNLKASGTGIQDALGNALVAGFTGDVYNIDQTAPTVATVSSPGGGTYGNGGVLSFPVHFSEAVNVTGSPVLNFTMDSGTAQATYFSGTGTSDLVFRYTIVSGDHDADGIAVNSLALNSGTITDNAGNNADLTLNGVALMTDVLIDAVPPVVTSITASSTPTNATSVDFAVTFSKSVIGVQLSDFSTAVTGSATGTPSAISGSGTTYTVTANSVSGDGTLGLNLNAAGSAIYDDNSNQLVAGFTGDTYTIDNTSPTISISAPSQTSVGNGGAVTVTYTVTYADANFNASTLSTGDITLNKGGSANADVAVSNAGTTSTVTLSNITGLGSLGISIAAGTANDLAGNLAPAAGPSDTFAVVSSDAKLSNLVMPQILNTTFDPNTTSYTISVPFTTTSTTVTPTANDAGATIGVQVNSGGYTPLTSGSTSGTLALHTGSNTIDVQVTAADAVTTKTYTVTANRAYSQLLSSLTFNPSVARTRADSADFVNYTATVSNSVSQVTVRPVALDASATITVNGTTVASGATSDPITLNIGANTILTVVTTPDNVTKTYKMVMSRMGDPRLSKLTLSKPGTNPTVPLTRVSGSDYADYTASVAFAVTDVTITPIATDGTATITVNGTTVASGNTSGSISLNPGDNVITTKVTAMDGAFNVYSITVSRAYSTDLTSLTFNPSTARTRVDSAGFVNFTTSVGNTVNQVTVTPVAADATATITVNGTTLASGNTSDPIALNIGANTILTVVTTPDNSTKTYKMVMTRAGDARLSKLTLSKPGANPTVALTRVSGADYADYTASVAFTVTDVTITPIAIEPSAVIKVNGTTVASGSASGSIALTPGDNVISTRVTSADGSFNVYSITVTRAHSTDLTALTFNPSTTRTRVDSANYVNYTTTVNNTVSQVTVTPAALDPTVTITVNGITLASGTTSDPILLNVGANTILTVVTTPDNVIKNYKMVMTRLAPPSGIMAYDQPKDMPIMSEAVVVHQNVSPNGDGNSDALKIDGIVSYPENKLQIMSRAGNLVYEVKGYDNTNKVFDGHSNDGRLQQAGTYFYSLEYKVGNETKHKTGYIVLKY